jgi:uncharacterized protein
MKYLALLYFTFCSLMILAQDPVQVRYIEVRGSAETEVEPDEMILYIGIQEYWEEEFEKKKEPKDYRTKVPLETIEDAVIKSLRKAGIEKEDVRVGSVGNYWREQGKEFLFSKQLEVKLSDFSKVNQLISLLDAKGIRNMNIGGFSHSDIDVIRKKIKSDALINAREKAAWMLESLGEELGEVLTVSEVNNGYNVPYKMESRMLAADGGMESIDQVQKITVSYEVDVKFRIK